MRNGTTVGAWTGTMLVVAAAVCFGFNPLFARLLYAEGVSPEAAAMFRFGVPALLLLPWLRLGRTDAGEALRTLLLGVGNAIGMVAYFRALAVVPVSVAVLVYYTYPLFSIAAGWLVFDRRPSREALVAVAMVAVAAWLVVSPEDMSLEQRRAIAACFLAPMAFGFIIQYLATPVRTMAPAARLGTSLGGHLLILGPLAFMTVPAGTLAPASATGWLAVAGLGIACAAAPQLMFVLGAPAAGAERTTVAGAGELIVSVLIGALAFGESLGRERLAAMVLVLLALMLPRSAPAGVRAGSGHADAAQARVDDECATGGALVQSAGGRDSPSGVASRP